MPSLKIKRGTRAQITDAGTANNLKEGELYLITDDKRLAVGLSASAYDAGLRKQSFSFGDGTATSFTITHDLNTTDVIVSVRHTATGQVRFPNWRPATATTVIIDGYVVAPTTNEFRAVIIG